MNNYTLTEGLHLFPTPAGAYYAVCSDELDKPRQFIRKLLLRSVTPALDLKNLEQLTETENSEESCKLLYECQKMQWVQGIEKPIEYPSDLLENILPDLLSKISESGKVLLADMQGFYLACHGFPHDLAEELSALSAELTTIHERRSGQLMTNLGIPNNAWGIIDVFGNSQIGFWPLYIGKNRFVIVISGIPHFNQPEFIELIWALSIRYAENTD